MTPLASFDRAALGLQRYAPYLFDFISTLLPATGVVMIVLAYKIIIREKPVTLQRDITPQVQNANAKWIHTSQKLYCLVIGIDTYRCPSLDDLRGAVSDANHVAEFLMSDLGVPPGHIVNLRNEQATRKRIIEELRHIWKNPYINHGDPILIYYAGHGGLIPANTLWKKMYGTGKIQVIFPHDYGCQVPGSTKPVKINYIPDKTIATMLNKVAIEKGDNITVIFDSCHHVVELDRKLTGRRQCRSAKVRFDMPDNNYDNFTVLDDVELNFPVKQRCDSELSLYTDRSAYVHLAASGAHQKAFEENGRGLFTAELLKKLRQNGVHNITYYNLIKSLEMPKYQSPQCYGRHKHRILFNSRISHNPPFVNVRPRLEGDSLTLSAGAASGVTLESIWEIHYFPTENSKPVGSFKVTDLYFSFAILKPLHKGSLLSNTRDCRLYARCINMNPGDDQVLKVWMSPDDTKLLFSGLEQYVGRIHESGVGYKMTERRGTADLVLEARRLESIEGPMNATRDVAFYWCDEVTKKYAVGKLGHRKPVDREEVEMVLFAAAKWKWHLQRTNSDTEQALSMWMLEVATRRTPKVPLMHLKEPKGVPMNDDGVVELVIESTTLYRLKLRSDLRLSALYIRIFYFNTDDFSIEEVFRHDTGPGEVTVNISGDQLLISDGTDGDTLTRFNISSTEHAKLGYMKAFWSINPLEIDYIKQRSAFKLRSADVGGASVQSTFGLRCRNGRGLHAGGDFWVNEWGTACIPLVLCERVSEQSP